MFMMKLVRDTKSEHDGEVKKIYRHQVAEIGDTNSLFVDSRQTGSDQVTGNGVGSLQVSELYLVIFAIWHIPIELFLKSVLVAWKPYPYCNLPQQKKQQKQQQQKQPQQKPVRQNTKHIPNLAAGVCIFINVATFSGPTCSANSRPTDPYESYIGRNCSSDNILFA